MEVEVELEVPAAHKAEEMKISRVEWYTHSTPNKESTSLQSASLRKIINILTRLQRRAFHIHKKLHKNVSQNINKVHFGGSPELIFKEIGHLSYIICFLFYRCWRIPHPPFMYFLFLKLLFSYNIYIQLYQQGNLNLPYHKKNDSWMKYISSEESLSYKTSADTFKNSSISPF